MNKPIEFFGYILTDDEAKACMDLLQDIWEEKRKKRLIEKYKNIISNTIAQSIIELGATETKEIIEDIYYKKF